MIEVKGITYRYQGGPVNVLEGLDLALEERSHVAVMGANGSGKSTLARCLNGMLVPDRGDVLVDGMSTKDELSRQRIRRRVGMVFQDPETQMTSVTVEREIAFGLENVGMERDQMQSIVAHQLEAFGLVHEKHTPPAHLSGGKKQLLAIASVMALQPRYLILDEALSHISARSRRGLLDLFSRLRQEYDVSIIFITQSPAEALTAKRLVILHKGRLALDGTPEDIFSRHEEVAAAGVRIPAFYKLRQLV
jgi:energy-coupling factor transport system ATP-binding protein